MWQRTPGTPSSTLFIIFWKISGALEIPEGSWLKQYCPKGVIKVVSSLEDFARGTRQNPLLASSLENSFAPESWARVSSTCGIGCVSWRTFSFSGLRSTHIWTPTDFYHSSTPTGWTIYFADYPYSFHLLEFGMYFIPQGNGDFSGRE